MPLRWSPTTLIQRVGARVALIRNEGFIDGSTPV
jgi:hypothetical protein